MIKEMKLHAHYSYGQLFGFSGLDGENKHASDFIGMMMHEKISIRFDMPHWIKLIIKVSEDASFDCVLSDYIAGTENGKNFALAFVAWDTIIGESPILPNIVTEKQAEYKQIGGIICFENDGFFFVLSVKEQEDGSYRFAFVKGNSEEETLIKAEKAFPYNFLKVYESKIEYYRELMKNVPKGYEELYSKCLSIQKVNVYSPQEGISCRWTTPDRIPHRHMWLWDSCFHALGFAEYNLQMAKESVLALFDYQQEDGFIAHTYFGDMKGSSEVTQPQVIAWAVWNIYQKDKDKEFLRACAEHLKSYLLWDKANRDLNGNDLLEWKTEFSYTECRCGESGMDNSPRFDVDEYMDAIDFSTFMAHDCVYLAKIYRELEEDKNAEIFEDLSNRISNNINTLLWSEEDGFYYDRKFSGELHKVKTCAGFLPLFAGICSKEQADKVVKCYLDERYFQTRFPIPSISADHSEYMKDMWRGCSWLNYNYFFILGLRKYGYNDLADELTKKTLDVIKEWYEKTGNVFEFYDAENEENPFYLERKGPQPTIPDYREHVHSITDYHWSACFTHLMIKGVMLI